MSDWHRCTSFFLNIHQNLTHTITAILIATATLVSHAFSIYRYNCKLTGDTNKKFEANKACANTADVKEEATRVLACAKKILGIYNLHISLPNVTQFNNTVSFGICKYILEVLIIVFTYR